MVVGEICGSTELAEAAGENLFLRPMSNCQRSERLSIAAAALAVRGVSRCSIVCLVYVEERSFDEMSEREQKQLTNDCIDYNDDLQKRGHLINASALQPVTAAATVRVRNGKVSTTDGPFAETKEHLGGFVLIEARDLNEAIQIAAKSPMARIGSIEVRPAMELKRSDLGA